MKNSSITYRILANSDSPVYLIQAQDTGLFRTLTDPTGKPIKFNGLSCAQEFLVSINIHDAELVFETAYDEMIGSPEDKNNSHYITQRHF